MKSIRKYNLVCEKVADYKVEAEGSMSTSEEVAKLLFTMGTHKLPNEHFYVICCDTKLNIVGIHDISSGILETTPVDCKIVLGAALLTPRTGGLIFAHNHTSGITDPSDEDINTTKRLIEASKLCGFIPLDHIIVGDENPNSLGTVNYISLRETHSYLF